MHERGGREERKGGEEGGEKRGRNTGEGKLGGWRGKGRKHYGRRNGGERNRTDEMTGK